MSDPLTPPPAASTVPPEHWWTTAISMVGHACAGVLHKIHAVEQNVSAWVKSNPNPEVRVLIESAETYLTSLLAGVGIPVSVLVSAEQAIEAGLGAMASLDPTIQSGTGVVPATATVTSTMPASAVPAAV